MPTNQGRDIDAALRAVPYEDIQALTVVLWDEVHSHPAGASCECPAMEVVAKLIELGYKIKKPGKSSLELVREAVVSGLDFWELVKDDPEYGGSIVDAIADEVVKLNVSAPGRVSYFHIVRTNDPEVLAALDKAEADMQRPCRPGNHVGPWEQIGNTMVSRCHACGKEISVAERTGALISTTMQTKT